MFIVQTHNTCVSTAQRPATLRSVCTFSKGENILEILNSECEPLLKSVKPHYGLADAPGYWWQTFKYHHEDANSLNMVYSSLDTCFFYQVTGN